ncbi:MAG: hypothetical protein JF593_09520 [Novosphingobium sp.]|nr:hypothetical protein [Novosphingobium sp.]
MKRWTLWLSALLVALIPEAAQAAWLEASSAHFVVYADDSEGSIRRLSDQLERYHAAIAFLTSAKLADPSPSNRVTVYVTSSEADVRRLYGAGGKYIGGFYIPRAGGSLAIVPKVASGSGEVGWSMVVLLHEYAHHFMWSSSNFPMPRWLSEGAAEFLSSAAFQRDGTISLGRPAEHRAGELFLAENVTAEDLLDPAAYAKHHKGGGYDAYYGKAWLLYHFLVFDPGRRGQLDAYIHALAVGKAQRQAALDVFGDFAVLEKDLNRYLDKPRMMMLRIPPADLSVGPVAVRRLRDGEAAMMPVRIRSRRGVDEKQAPEVLAAARAVAAKYPGDPAVQSALAEAEYDAGNDKEAIAAADAALARDSSQVNAYVQKGFALFRMAKSASDRAAAYARARAPFVALNRIENDHPLPLVYYYRSFVEQGTPPTPTAFHGLQRAVELAPFDLGLRMTLAMEEIRRHDPALARWALTPVAYNPHGGRLAEQAKRVLARLDADPKWDGRAGLEDLVAASASDDGGDGE